MTCKQRAVKMEYYKVLLVLVFVALSAKQCLAAQHIVGGSQGWEESTDFNSWASGQKFKVGDQLVFKYSPLHSVVELPSESAYKNCDIGTAVNTLSTGNDVVKLTKPGTHYFACGTMGHCEQGMKVKITTDSGTSASSSSDSSSSSSSPTTSMASRSFRPFALVVFVSLATVLIYIMF
ncbi:mavicyanin [Mercurialis annua]|uniref:mavicyanin n=1 Tax=Mercurialis annua TaxID=3986 RepID=UPI00215E3266|nr:mavicyanin [Mercurialis annua]